MFPETTPMLRRILFFVMFTLICTLLSAQGKISSNSPIHYRLLMTSVNIEDVQPDKISVSLNAFNTGRKPIDLSEFNSPPAEMEIKFEESFHRSSLSELQDEILRGLFTKNIVLPNGKILRNLRFNLPCNETLYKQLNKKNNKFTKAYTPKKRNNGPELKYKTSDKKAKSAASFASNKKSKSKKKDIKETVASNPEPIKSTTIRPSKPNNSTTKVDPKISSSNQEINDKKPKKQVEVDKKYSRNKTEVKDEREEKEITEKESTLSSTNKVEVVKNSSSNIAETVNEENTKKLSIIERQELKRKEREEIKENEYKIEKASQNEDEKAILESLGVGKTKDKKDDSVAFDTRASVEASKNSYADKARCPDLILDKISVVKNNGKWVTLEYTLSNVGKGPAYLGKSHSGQGIPLRAFLSSSDKISRGALPLGGGFVNYKDGKESELYPNDSYTGTLKLDIRKMTRFTPYVIINFDPFNSVDECDKTNNYGNVKVGG